MGQAQAAGEMDGTLGQCCEVQIKSAVPRAGSQRAGVEAKWSLPTWGRSDGLFIHFSSTPGNGNHFFSYPILTLGGRGVHPTGGSGAGAWGFGNAAIPCGVGGGSGLAGKFGRGGFNPTLLQGCAAKGMSEPP